MTAVIVVLGVWLLVSIVVALALAPRVRFHPPGGRDE